MIFIILSSIVFYWIILYCIGIYTNATVSLFVSLTGFILTMFLNEYLFMHGILTCALVYLASIIPALFFNGIRLPEAKMVKSIKSSQINFHFYR